MPAIFKLSLPSLLWTLACLNVACDSRQQTGAEGSRTTFDAYENQKVFGNYTIHANALTTDQLAPEVAREYGIVRSKGKAMLNIVITKGEANEPVTGTVTAVAKNLTNQIKDMEMLEIIEQDAIYYIGVISVDNEETIVFNIDATPANENQPFLLSYRQQFFTN